MCRVPARTEDTMTSAVVVVSPVRVLRPKGTCPSVRDPAPRTAQRPRQCRRPGEALRYAQSGSTVTPRVRPGPQCHAAPGPGNSGRRGLPAARSQAATRRWPTSLRIPGNHGLCGRRPRMRAQDDVHQSGLEAATRPLPFGERGSPAHSRHRTRASSHAATSRISSGVIASRRYRS